MHLKGSLPFLVLQVEGMMLTSLMHLRRKPPGLWRLSSCNKGHHMSVMLRALLPHATSSDTPSLCSHMPFLKDRWSKSIHTAPYSLFEDASAVIRHLIRTPQAKDSKKCRNFRKAIPPEHRLALVWGRSTACMIVTDVCQVIWEVLGPVYISWLSTPAQWLKLPVCWNRAPWKRFR